MKIVRGLTGLVVSMLLISSAAATELRLTIDSSAAKAVLAALDNPALTLDQARVVAKLPGNQGLIRKAISYGRTADVDSFAAALVATAHGDDKAPDPSQFQFGVVRKQAETLRQVIAELENPKNGLIEGARQRIALFTPDTATGSITGYFVVGGTSGGFAFGDPTFFLNLQYFPDAVLATTILEHELFHAVQGAARPIKAVSDARQRCLTRIGMPEHMDDLFDSLFVEGTASAVGDVLALPKDATGIIGDERKKVQRNVNMVSRSVTLFDLSTHAVASKAVDFDSIYELGFYGDEILYALGYVMAKTIEREDGPPGIAALIRQSSGAAFIDRYRKVKDYGTSADAPALGAATLDWAKRMAACNGG
ncbi:DUF5700 domain-containing putative Zn-dependent protease [Sphingomonas sp. 28-63-12]|uniref:DUF5700 domain-containing putative Zn-dependent protease n=1 Tax=Sphingomonas sp. 28-63-12 TaxID=1970434 RepID=UPI000BC4D04E|nr:MAG: hypothetical protein B7Y47_00645 [Sphingomonas sp. 28-63-12]